MNCCHGYRSPIDMILPKKTADDVNAHLPFYPSHLLKDQLLSHACLPAQMTSHITGIQTINYGILHQVPVLGVNLQTFPIIGIIGGFLYSTYCYFYVILNGGVGKNGSTVAVSVPQNIIVYYKHICF